MKIKYFSLLLLVFLIGCAAPGYNKTVNVTVLGTHHIYEVPKDSEIITPDGQKKTIKEDSMLTSEYYFSKILKAKVNFKDKADEETISPERINN